MEVGVTIFNCHISVYTSGIFSMQVSKYQISCYDAHALSI